jgi:hypothetical protein
MKTIAFILLTLLIASTLQAQNLLDIYKTGTVKLVPDSEFAQGNDWNTIFRDYHHKIGNEQVGNRKSLCLMPDGSFVVNHAYNKTYTKFSPEGNFVKEFNIKNSSGQVLKRSSIKGVLDNEILFTDVDNSGRMYCTDLNGKLIKTLEVKYMDKNIIALPNRKFAIAGTVLWKNRFRDMVSIKDYETGEEKIIWDSFSPSSTVVVIDIPDKNGKNSPIKTIAPPPPPNSTSRSQPSIIVTNKNEVLVCVASTGELLFYDLNGNLLRTKKVNWQNDKIPVEELLKKHDEARERIANREITERMIERYGSEERAKQFRAELLKQHDARRELIKKPQDLPYYSTIIEDSDGNILFFEYAKEKGDNQFNVYTLNGDGEFVCKSSFVCNDYDLVINRGRLVFKNGYLYGVQELKDKSEIPMRLVKYKLEAVK